MFCFPYPRNTDVESIRMPLITQNRYSITGQPDFSALFIRAFNVEVLQSAKAAECIAQVYAGRSSTHSFASVVQSLLFFGLASEALGRHIKPEEFAAANSHGNCLSMDLRIPKWYYRELKARWDELDDSLDVKKFEAKRIQLIRTCKSAQVLIDYLDNLANRSRDDNLTGILLATHMLLYLVAYVLDSNTPKLTWATASSASTRLLKRRMVKNGWCEKRLGFLSTSPMCYPALYFLSSLKPPRINAEDHSGCGIERCLVTSKLSKPIHRTDECLCEDIVVPIDRVNTIVASGGIPLIRIVRSPAGMTELEVVPYTRSSKFVAISHVWADQQFGSAQNCLPKCQVGYLEGVLSTLPTLMDHWGLRDWVTNWRASSLGEIAPSSRAYEYFWLDSFCIPQAEEHTDLRSKAIGSMNLIYAAASYTLVFDKGLQALDAGQRPASLMHGGRSTYYSPQIEHLLDVVAYIYASNWMGRAWTLQEAILSGYTVFPLHGSLAHLKLLAPHDDDGNGNLWDILAFIIPTDLRRSFRGLLPRIIKPKTTPTMRVEDEFEPLRESVQHELFTHMKESLHVEEYSIYSRTPVSCLFDFQDGRFLTNARQAERAARFVKAHSLLQSRTTTQAEDIPLILMNMSCMNANAISQSKTTDARMKQLFYGLESLPAELLFSNCARLGSCTVDAWIPCDIAHESFGGIHTLKLGSAGFTFEPKVGPRALKFYLLSSVHGRDHFQLLLPDRKAGQSLKYNVQALRRSGGEKPAAARSVWCIAVDNESLERGARFVVNRIVGNKYFLHFDCPLRLSRVDDSQSANNDQQEQDCECGAVRPTGDFIIERNHEAQELSISRPQNPKQYGDRLVVVSQALHGLLSMGERRLLRAIWGDENAMSTLFYIFYSLYCFKKGQWVENAVNAFVHQAWMRTYQPDWDPNGPWKWYWKLSNWVPPIPFKTLMKWWCCLVLFLNFLTKSWLGVASVTLFWLPLYPRQQLIRLYVVALSTRLSLSFFFYVRARVEQMWMPVIVMSIPFLLSCLFFVIWRGECMRMYIEVMCTRFFFIFLFWIMAKAWHYF